MEVSSLRFDLCTNVVSCHTAGQLKGKPRGFASKQQTTLLTHLRPLTSPRYNPFALENAKDLTAFIQPPTPDPCCPSKPLLRVISNKFPALKGSLSNARMHTLHAGTAANMIACGFQEVCISHWSWRSCQALMTREQMILLWETLRTRCVVNCAKENAKYVQVMENHGVRSGASLPHPHSQILALPFVPPDQMSRLQIAASWHQTHNARNIFDHVMDGARDDNRVLLETQHAIAFVPYAQNRSYEIWVVSKTSPDMRDEEYMDEMADMIRKCLLMLYCHLDDPDYNSIVRQSTESLSFQTASPAKDWYRWHVVITQHGKRSRWAGIKGYGDFVPVNGTPEEHAEQLREHSEVCSPLQLSATEKETSTLRVSSDIKQGRIIAAGFGVVMLACELVLSLLQ